MGSLSQFWGRRQLPSAKVAVSSLQLIHAGQSVQILVLSKTSMDCWQVSQAGSQHAVSCSSMHPVCSELQQYAPCPKYQKMSLTIVLSYGSRDQAEHLCRRR